MPHNKLDYSAAIALRAAGMTYNQIAERLGKRPNTVRMAIARRQGPQNTAKCTPDAIANAVQTGLAAQSASIRKRLADVISSQAAVIERNPAKSLKALANNRQREGIASVTRTIVNTAATVFDWESEKQVGLIVVGQISSLGEPPPIDVEAKEIPLNQANPEVEGGEPLSGEGIG